MLIGARSGAVCETGARNIGAGGEQETARPLVEPAVTIAATLSALEPRRLQTLTEIVVEHNPTVVIMLPTELLRAAEALGVRAKLEEEAGEPSRI